MAVWCLELLPALLLMVVYWTAGDRSVTMATTANIGRYPTANSTFTWLASAWGDCVHREAGTCCACYRTRNVSCVLRGDLTRVPAFYCHKLLGVEPGVREPCSPCQQDCVLSTWGQWSACSQTCPPASRYRMRQILVLPQDGGERCGNLMEEERCPPSQSQAATWACGDARDHRPRYSWKYNGWTGCRKHDEKTLCGPGSRYRQVYCASRDGQRVADRFCYFYQPEVDRPVGEEDCQLPCPCQMDQWADWAPCSRSCYKGFPDFPGYTTRTRGVRLPAQRGGVGCPPDKEAKRCPEQDLPLCQRYTWHTTEWDACYVEGVTDAWACGSGIQERKVFCTREGDPSHRPVEDVLCVQDAWLFENSTLLIRPVDKRACEVSCPTSCQLGEWENWSSCTQSCGKGGQRHRTRPVLVDPSLGGKPCGEKMETRECLGITPCMWWHTGRWSACFVDSPEGRSCGRGTQMRNVFCLSALDEILDDVNCSTTLRTKKQRASRKCRVPCEGECQVSTWSEWSGCSASCGPQGGTQSRTRTILSQPDDAEEPCLQERDMEQTRTCNQKSCNVHLWQVGPWSSCMRLPNASLPCGNNTGTQRRDTYCELYPGYQENITLCEPTRRPSRDMLCSAPCPVDCQLSPWSSWSQCSSPCGAHSKKVMYRTVTQVSLHGGVPCPAQARVTDGVVIKQKRCKSSPSCQMYRWVSGSWEHCEVGSLGCGPGTRHRNVSCVRQDARVVAEDLCHEDGAGLPPERHQSCYFPCDGDCLLTDWSDFSSCSQTCGTQPGIRVRTRSPRRLDLSLTLETQCPHLLVSDLNTSQPCGHTPCPSYSWHAGQWGSCVVHQPSDQGLLCGLGIQRRHVVCRRDDQNHVANHFCDILAPMEDKHRTCTVPCPVDCRMSPWTTWSNCSQSCGIGLVERTRMIEQEPQTGGRSCGHLVDTENCKLRDCDEFTWVVSLWGECEPYYGMSCGRGRQHRTVACPAGEEFKHECERRSPQPQSLLNCEKPCLGDCILTEWGDFGPCSCPKPTFNGTRWRERRVLKYPLPSATPCGALNESDFCQCEVYRLSVGAWTSCLISSGPEKNCGTGLRQRGMNCVRNQDNVPVSMEHCSPAPRIPLTATCDVPCPVDCEVEEFGEWTPCSQTCGVEAMKTRHRAVLVAAKDGGRLCPHSSQLQQTTTCHTNLCYSYSWDRSEWSTCDQPDFGCGVGVMNRTIQCLRSDSEVVDDKFCFMGETRVNAQELSQLSNKDFALLDLAREQSCGAPCPGDCVISEWSDYSPCFKNCSVVGHPGKQVRTRVVIRPPQGGRACPLWQVDIRQCSDKESLCPIFYWKSTEWNDRDKRKVYCTMHDESRVMGGCVRQSEPSRYSQCQTACGGFSSCDDGRCTCEKGFSGDGLQCLPDFGCVMDSHCVIPNTTCDTTNKECLCLDGTLPRRGLYCSAEDHSALRGDFGGLNALFVYVLIACLCALLLLALLITVIIVRKRTKKKPDHKIDYTSPTLNKIDNLDTTQKNNELNADHMLMTKTCTIGSNYNKHINEVPHRSPYGTIRSKSSSTEDSDSKNETTPSPPPHARPNGPTDVYHVNVLDGESAVEVDDGSKRHLYNRQPLLTNDPLNDLDTPMFGSVASRGCRMPVTENINSGVQPHVPETQVVRTSSSGTLKSDAPKLSTFKPDPDEGVSPQAGHHPVNPQWTNSRSPSRGLPAPPPPVAYPDAYSQGPAGSEAAMQSTTQSPRSQTRPPGRRNVVAPRPTSPEPKPGLVNSSRTPAKIDKKDSAAQNLLEYCDELLADLERVANS